MTAADTIALVHEPSARSDAAYAPHVDPSSVASKTSETSCGWRPAPGELGSLWDMLRIHAETFLWLSTSLRDTRTKIDSLAKTESKLNDLGGSALLRAIQPEVNEDLVAANERTAAVRAQIIEHLRLLAEVLAKSCTSLELPISLAQVERFRGLLEPTVDLAALSLCVESLESRVGDELRTRMFWFVPPNREKYSLEEHPFGKQVTDKFPKQSEDIKEAASCLCFGRYTAAVFHLMRVMERSVHFFAEKRLGIAGWSIDDKEWGKILTKINGALDAEDARIAAASAAAGSRVAANRAAWAQIKKAKRKLAGRRETAAYLHHVKDAWRNDTMHAKRTYTQEQAEEVFKYVSTFMRSLTGAKHAAG
jgi:hypothetical protein